MKSGNFLESIIFLLLFQLASAELSLPSDISKALANGDISESGGFWTNGIDEARFRKYINEHWREIADDIDSLPAVASESRDSSKSEKSKESQKLKFGVACDRLPPVDYI